MRIRLEAGQLASWLYHGLDSERPAGDLRRCRHARAALSLKVNKTDVNDALGPAQIMRVGWYRKVEVKGHGCQALRALLVVRAQLVSQATTLKNCVRGILKVFGRVLPKKLRAQFIARAHEATGGDATWRQLSSRCCVRSRQPWSSLESMTTQRCAMRVATRRFAI
jgi:transposase